MIAPATEQHRRQVAGSLEDEVASRADRQLDERLRAGNSARPVTGAGEAGRQIQPRAKNLKRWRDLPVWARRDSVTASG